MRSRRANNDGASGSRRQALEELRSARKGLTSEDQSKEPSSLIASYKPKEESIFKVITDEEYVDLVRQRRKGLPFVANDEIELGYYDDGEEQFFEDNETEETVDETDEMQERIGRKGALSSAYARRAKKMQRARLGDGGDTKIRSLFQGKPGMHASKRLKTSSSTAKNELDLDSLLEDLTNNPMEKPSVSQRNPSFAGIPSFNSYDEYLPAPVANVEEHAASVAYEHEGYNEVDDEEEDMAPEISEISTTPERCDVKLSKRDILLQKARESELKSTAPAARSLSAEMIHRPAPIKAETPKDMVMEPEFLSNEVSEWWQASSCSNDVIMQSAEENSATTPACDDRIKMFWMDAIEVKDRPGKLYLIGKTRIGSGSQAMYKSCCVVIQNLERCMYFVPKVTPEFSENKQNALTMHDLSVPEQQALWMKMHHEIHQLLIPKYITARKDQEIFQTKLVEREYAFEEADMPRGKSKYVKVRYPARYPIPPSQICDQGGQYYARICGASTRPLEIFLLRRKLLGPSWIELRNVRVSKSQASFCQLEFEMDNPKDVHTLHGEDDEPPPPLTILSLGIKSYCNPNSQQHEIVALSMIVEIDKSDTSSRTMHHFTIVRPIDSNEGFPDAYTHFALQNPRFKARSNAQPSVKFEMNERSMLSYFLNRVQLEDPDVIVGHNLHKYTLHLLLTRIDHFKLGGLWSKLTRLRRGRLQPLSIGQGWNEYRLDDMSNGRLFCDTCVSSKELLSSQSSYSLTHLTSALLQKQRFEIEMTEIPFIIQHSPQQLTRFLCHTLDDAMFVLQLMHHLQVLPLSKQLANLCGYLWPKTLESNTRAERIEYLLLHEFSKSKNKFILPNKQRLKKTGKTGKREKASYAGGMVFAPKKGLYDNFVVLLDFNSLYPSIIREYNICFTTVSRSLQGQGEEEEDVPPLPSASSREGVLPNVIKRLLESRKQVKQALAQATRSQQIKKAETLDIRQKAIKLTANSIYGCLGFKQSRFYAKSIAALITSTGRQTLQRAKEVAEIECGYDVIYGDTDSIMVDSKTDELQNAKRIGRQIQLQCNKHFKLLELEVDNIFKTILLLNKKKYAALVVKEAESVSYVKEVKGLDLVRRDWCVISKMVGHEILDRVLSGNPREEIVQAIHSYLSTIATRIRSGQEPLEQFVITKALNKQPEQYPDGVKQHHVQVALALRQQGRLIGVGSCIPYVICRQLDAGSNRVAYHPDEIKRAQDKLEIDYEWYIESQIHPPVNRLCAHIEGTSSAQLAHYLGLEGNKFSNLLENPEEEVHMIPGVLQNDQERFKDCAPLIINCRKCEQALSFPGSFQVVEGAVQSGLFCPQCRAEYWGYDAEGMYGYIGDDFVALLSNRLQLAIREAVKRYYACYVVCTDVTCKLRTQKQSLIGNGDECSAEGCHAAVQMEYSDHDLYTQLIYLSSLFDYERQKRKITDEQGRVAANDTKIDPFLPESHCRVLNTLFQRVKSTIELSDYNWIQPSLWQTLFT